MPSSPFEHGTPGEPVFKIGDGLGPKAGSPKPRESSEGDQVSEAAASTDTELLLDPDTIRELQRMYGTEGPGFVGDAAKQAYPDVYKALSPELIEKDVPEELLVGLGDVTLAAARANIDLAKAPVERDVADMDTDAANSAYWQDAAPEKRPTLPGSLGKVET